MENKDWIALAALLFGVLNALYLYVSQSRRATKADIDNHGERLTKIEATIATLPSKDSFHALEMNVESVKGSIRVLEEGLKPVQNGIGRLERFIENIEFSTPTSARRKSK